MMTLAAQPSANAPRALSERALVFVIGAVQFANILDFMMVMPLGPDFAQGLGIHSADLGLIGGAYTAAAAVAGLVGSLWLERFDRRTALTVSMIGLAVGTAAGGFAYDLPSLIVARLLAGFWGGPATSVSLSIIADVIPAQRRGKAMGAVMGAFAAASVLGVPAGLELARRGSWRTPFFAVAALGLLTALAARHLIPPMTGHLRTDASAPKGPGLWTLLQRSDVSKAMLLTTLVMMGSFCLIPNIATYVQLNLGFPRERLGSLYLIGGIVSFFATQVAGRLIDRTGVTRAGSFGAILLIAIVFAGYYVTPPLLSVPAIFLVFFLAMAFRNVPLNTLMTLVPGPQERAAFLSLQSATQHLAASLGAFASAQLLSERPDHGLIGMDRVAILSMVTTLGVPVLMWQLDRHVRQRAVQSPG